jgi:hypothetical protein
VDRGLGPHTLALSAALTAAAASALVEIKRWCYGVTGHLFAGEPRGGVRGLSQQPLKNVDPGADALTKPISTSEPQGPLVRTHRHPSRTADLAAQRRATALGQLQDGENQWLRAQH